MHCYLRTSCGHQRRARITRKFFYLQSGLAIAWCGARRHIQQLDWIGLVRTVYEILRCRTQTKITCRFDLARQRVVMSDMQFLLVWK